MLSVDYWIKSSDKDSFIYARRLISEEGILCSTVVQFAKSLTVRTDKELLLLQKLYDKFLNDGGMKENGYIDEHIKKEEEMKIQQWRGAMIKDLNLKVAVTINSRASCKEAIEIS